MLVLIILCLLAAAALFGLFFLGFKLVFILLQRNGNKWPLILAGAATALICAWTVYATYNAYRRFAVPFMPVFQAIQTQTAPTLGQHLYTDARYGISVTLPDATVMTDWIEWQNNAVLFGLDTNAFLKDGKEYPFTGFLLVRQIMQTPPNPVDMATALTDQLENMSSQHGSIEVTSQPHPVQLANGATGALTTGLLYADSIQQPLPAAMLVVTRGEEIYYFGGISSAGIDVVTTTLNSLHLPAL